MENFRPTRQNTPKVSPATRTSTKSRQKNHSRFFRTTQSHSFIRTPLSREEPRALRPLGTVHFAQEVDATPPSPRAAPDAAVDADAPSVRRRKPPAPQKHPLQLFEMMCFYLINHSRTTEQCLYCSFVVFLTRFPPQLTTEIFLVKDRQDRQLSGFNAKIKENSSEEVCSNAGHPF
jgi:hypothetical protein